MITSSLPTSFNPANDEWFSYIGRFRMFMEANDPQDLTENRKRTIFLSYCGPEMYKMAKLNGTFQELNYFVMRLAGWLDLLRDGSAIPFGVLSLKLSRRGKTGQCRLAAIKTTNTEESLEDVGKVWKGVQKDHDRLCTLVTPMSEHKKTPGPPNSIRTPPYAPLYLQHISPLDYQHNVYIPGTPTSSANKDGSVFLEQESKNSFSTFGKRKKMINYSDKHDSIVINNLK